MALDGLSLPALDWGRDVTFLLKNGDRLLSGMRFPFLQWFCEKTAQPLVGWENANMIARVRGARPLAVVLYNHFWKPDIWMHIAAEEGTMWCTPDFVEVAFSYPFIELGCGRVTGLLGEKTHHHHKLMIHLGFTREGRIREALPTGDALIMYGMLRRECRWIGESDGQAKRTSAA